MSLQYNAVNVHQADPSLGTTVSRSLFLFIYKSFGIRVEQHVSANLHRFDDVLCLRKIFTGNEDQYTVKSHRLSIPIIARYIRFRPKLWNGHISMRVALYGCTSGKKGNLPKTTKSIAFLHDIVMVPNSYIVLHCRPLNLVVLSYMFQSFFSPLNILKGRTK